MWKDASKKMLLLSGKIGPVFALILVIAIFGSIEPGKFFSFQNFSNVAGQTAVIAIAAIGMTFVIVSAGIDLSVGSLVALAGVYATMIMSSDHLMSLDYLGKYLNSSSALSLGIFVGLLTGAVCGLISGVVITRGKLAPFIVTLGMMEILRGVALQSAGGLPVTNLPNNFSKIGNAVWSITISRSLEFSEDELNFTALSNRFRDGTDPAAQCVRANLSDETKTMLEEYKDAREIPDELKESLVKDLNAFIRSGPIYTPERFENSPLSDRLMYRINKNPQGNNLIHLNRLILEDAYPNFIEKGDMILLIPYPLFILIPLAFLAGFVLKYTVFGVQVYAVGSNEQTAQLCGVNVNRVKVLVYIIGGVTAGLAGIIHASRLNTGQPSEALGMELEVIAAVVIGGGSLMGGEGTILGSIMGAFIIKFLRNGCNIVGVSSFVQRIVIGLIIIVAVYIDQLRRKSLAQQTTAKETED